MPTLEPLATTERFTLFGVNMSTAVAGLRGIGRRYKQHGYASYQSFVAYKYSELIESPVVCPTSLNLATSLFVEALSNVGQILKRQRCVTLFCLLNQLLADAVIQPLLEALFSTREPSQQSSRTASAFALNSASDLGISVASSLNLCSTPTVSSGNGSDVSASQINPNYLGCFARWLSGDFNADVDVVVTLSSFIQRCAGRGLPSEQCNLISTNGQLKLLPARDQSHPSSLQIFVVSKRSRVQIQRCWAEFVNLFDCLSIANHTANCLTNVISFQARRRSDALINQVMQLGCVPLFSLFCYVQDLIASHSKPLQRQVNFLAQLFRDYQLAFNRQDLHLRGAKTHPLLYSTSKSMSIPLFCVAIFAASFAKRLRRRYRSIAAPIPPCPRTAGFLGEFR
jgi:hypothetical protein